MSDPLNSSVNSQLSIAADPEILADDVRARSVMTSPLANRLPKHLPDSPLTQEEEDVVQSGVRQILKHLKRADPIVIEAILKTASRETCSATVEEGCRRFAKAASVTRTPSQANLKRVKRICITNVLGFLNGHLVAEFLKAGLTVKGLVPDARSRAKVAYLESLEKGDEASLSLEVCDMREKGLMKAFSDVDCVVHSAWPVVKAGRSQQDIVDRSLKLMSLVMTCAQNTAGIRHVVVTSSTAAVRLFSPLSDPAKGFTGDEWSDETKLREHNMDSALALLLTERLAWEMHSEQLSKTRRKIKLSSICVGQAVGPSLSGEDVCKCLATISPEACFPKGLEERELGPADVFDTTACASLGVSFRSLRSTLQDLVDDLKLKVLLGEA